MAPEPAVSCRGTVASPGVFWCCLGALLFRLGCVGRVEFEEDDVSVLHGVVAAQLSVFTYSLLEENYTNVRPMLSNIPQ